MDINLNFLLLFVSESVLLSVIVQAVNFDEVKVAKAEPTLQYVIGIYRHGIRSPLYFHYKTDPYVPDSKYFPEGKGRLSKAGKKMMYNVGRTLRARYGSFIGDNEYYDGRKIRFSTTSGSRNIQSAVLVTEGMYSKGQKYPESFDNKNFKRQSNAFINFTTAHFDKSYLVSKYPMAILECKYFCNQFIYNLINKLMLPQTEEHVGMYKYLSQKTGNSFTSVVSFLNIWDRLECQRLNGYKLPDWTKEVYPHKMLPLALSFVKETIAGTKLMNTLGSALLLTEIRRALKSALESKIEEKAYFHATHENSLYQLLFKMNIKEPAKVEVGDVFLFELHKEKQNSFLKMYYYSPFENTLNQLKVPGCNDNCPVDQFFQLIPEMSHQEWKSLCKTKPKSFLTFMQSLRNLFHFFKELMTWIF